MITVETTLPEKCCAKCGFLYALKYDKASSYDPDLIRHPGFFSETPIKNDKFITTRFLEGGSRAIWIDDFRLICFQNVVSPFNRTSTSEKELPALKDFLFRSRITGDNTCPNYVSYRPGFSAKEHAEIRMQEERDKQQQEFQDKWNSLIFEAEENARKREERWKQLEEKHRIYNIWFSTANFILALILGGVLVAEFLSKLIPPP